jgi:hypothetical protein
VTTGGIGAAAVLVAALVAACTTANGGTGPATPAASGTTSASSSSPEPERVADELVGTWKVVSAPVATPAPEDVGKSEYFRFTATYFIPYFSVTAPARDDGSPWGALWTQGDLLFFGPTPQCHSINPYRWTLRSPNELQTELVGTDPCGRSDFLTHGVLEKVPE